MTDLEQLPQGLVRLTGIIANYKCMRAEASFVFSDSDQATMGVVALAAGVSGLSGQAISTAVHATATEDADYVEFELNGKPCKGWAWRSPFGDGDVVEVAAEWQGVHFEVAGISRPSDRLLAMFPHCSRGKARHIKNAIKWWLIGVTVLNFVGLLVLIPVVGTGTYWHEARSYVLYNGLGFYAFFGLMTFSLARKWMPFVRLAENVFATLGFPNPSNVDLVKSSKAQRKPDDPGEFGTFYFRY